MRWDTEGLIRGARGGTGPCKKTQTPPALGLGVGRTSTPARGLRAGGAGQPGLVSRLAALVGRGRARLSVGRNREAGSFVNLTRGKEAARGPREPARAPPHVRRLHWEVAAAERLDRLRAGRGGGREVGRWRGPAGAASFVDARPAPQCWVLRGARRQAAGVAMGSRWGFLIRFLGAVWLLGLGHCEQQTPETAAQRCFCQVRGVRGRAAHLGAPSLLPALFPVRPGR